MGVKSIAHSTNQIIDADLISAYVIDSRMGRNYGEMRIWKNAMDLAVEIYHLVAKFPKSEQYGLAAQMRRAVVSISSNIAEGCAGTNLQFKSHLRIALGSAYELHSQVLLCAEVGITSAESTEELESDLLSLIKMMHSYHNRVE